MALSVSTNQKERKNDEEPTGRSDEASPDNAGQHEKDAGAARID
jgi:hypothetical protein